MDRGVRGEAPRGTEPMNPQITQMSADSERRDPETFAIFEAKAQVINHLKTSGTSRSLLLNFDSPCLHYTRTVFNLRKSAASGDNNLGIYS